MAVEEVVKSERSYLRHLEIIQEYFATPLEESKILSNKDFTDQETQSELLEILNNQLFDIVLSDMAPNATGNKKFDHERSARLAFQVRDFTLKYGSKNCSMVIKVWNGGLIKPFVLNLQEKFERVSYVKPKASRQESAEIYVVANRLIKNL